MKYKNITENDLFIPNFGLVKAGAIAEMPDGFHNANFKAVPEPKTIIEKTKNTNE